MINLYKKQDDSRLCTGLSLEEFKCRCSHHTCRMTMVNQEFIVAYERLRSLLNRPLKINSGFRCAYHNYQVGGVACSFHQTGRAIDISKKTIDYLSDADFEHAAKQSGFTFVKAYSTFYHCDVR